MVLPLAGVVLALPLTACGGSHGVTSGTVIDSWHVAPVPSTTAYCASAYSKPGPGGGSRTRSTVTGSKGVTTRKGPGGIKIRTDRRGRLLTRDGRPCPHTSTLTTWSSDQYRLLLQAPAKRKFATGWITVSWTAYNRCFTGLRYPACAHRHSSAGS